MRHTLLLALAASFMCAGYSTAQTTRKGTTREEEKVAQEALDNLLFEEAKQAIESKTFVLEADQVVFKEGTNAFVSSNTNFVGVDNDNAVVQVAFNIPVSGPNGLGGITVDGKVSDFKTKADKKGNVIVSMNVMGTGISAQIDIMLTEGSNSARVDISPNFNSNRFTLIGKLIPMNKSNVLKGRSL